MQKKTDTNATAFTSGILVDNQNSSIKLRLNASFLADV